MQLIRHLPSPFKDARKSALTIGNFDGLHRGHLALIERAVAAGPEQVPSLMCFEPLPATFFQPDQPIRRVMKLRDRFAVCRARGIQRFFQLHFNQKFAAQSPEEFIDEVVLAGAQAGHVIVGEDFRFGRRAAGNVDDLLRFGRQKNFDVSVVETVAGADGVRYSSTALRRALANNDFKLAEQILGRPYRISGRVLRGQQLGRRLGFPTINLRVPEPPVLSGVFAVTVKGEKLPRQNGIANLGKRPSVAGRDWLLEVHLLDFNGDLYGQHLGVDFIAKRRDEAHFERLDDMVVVMREDLRWAKQMFTPASERKAGTLAD
ncbi:MAG: bifunctional riboflavin kinase/FAD synthetase [Symploca sp. SIO2G7]|nr:bifunctional riboflavin kinase/FAD synthetase [Symploca sp. SIO2G7]